MKRKNTNKTVEEKIYELLGVLFFKRLVLLINKGIRHPLEKLVNKIDADLTYSFDNYRLTESSLKGLKKFKLQGLLFNSCIHFTFMIMGIISLAIVLSSDEITISTLISPYISVTFNGYCSMLQRYNHIRINRTIKKIKERDSKREQDKALGVQKTLYNLTNSSNIQFSDDKVNTPIPNDNPSLKNQIKILKFIRKSNVDAIYNDYNQCQKHIMPSTVKQDIIHTLRKVHGKNYK